MIIILAKCSVSLTIATFGLDGESWSEKKLPLSNGIPIKRKYSGLTVADQLSGICQEGAEGFLQC